MKILLVLVGIFGLSWGATTPWPEHDCTIDHEPDPDDPHGFLVKGSGTWNKRTCFPEHLVYQHAPNCTCVWPDQDLTYGDCNTINRPVPGEPDYIFEYWHPVDNVWYSRNCHDVFPISYHHSNDQLFFNVTGCRCDWLPIDRRGSLTVDLAADCTLDMDIPMVEQPPRDRKGSFVQPYNPVWVVWPPTVPLERIANRDAICFDATRLKSWYLTGNQKPNIWFLFGLYSRPGDKPGSFTCVLSDGCIWGQAYPATFQLWYRASDIAFRVEYKGTTWECNPGGNGENRWIDVGLFFGRYSTYISPTPAVAVAVKPVGWMGDWPPFPWPFLFVNNNMCDMRVTRQDGHLPRGYFELQATCQLNFGGNELEPTTKYTGCMSGFQEMSGLSCSSRGMP